MSKKTKADKDDCPEPDAAVLDNEKLLSEALRGLRYEKARVAGAEKVALDFFTGVRCRRCGNPHAAKGLSRRDPPKRCVCRQWERP